MWYRAEKPVASKISMPWAENVEFCEFLAFLSTENIKKLSGMIVDIIYSVYLLSPASVASRKNFFGQKSAVILS